VLFIPKAIAYKVIGGENKPIPISKNGPKFRLQINQRIEKLKTRKFPPAQPRIYDHDSSAKKGTNGFTRIEIISIQSQTMFTLMRNSNNPEIFFRIRRNGKTKIKI